MGSTRWVGRTLAVVIGAAVLAIIAPPVQGQTSLPAVATVTTNSGPAQFGFTPAELGLFAGTSSGDAANLRRFDYVTGVKETWRWDGRAHTWTLLSAVPQPSTDPSQPGDTYGATAGTMPTGQGDTFVYSGGRTYFNNPHSATYDYRAEMFILDAHGTYHAAPCNTAPTGCAPGPLDGGSSATNGTDTLLFGGESPTTGAESNALWRWNGSDWDAITPTGTPPAPRAVPAFFFDGTDFIVFGGGAVGPTGPEAFGDTWRLSKTDTGWSWQQVCDSCGIAGRYQMYAAALYRIGDATPGGLVVGGYTFENYLQAALSDKWRWDGSTWTKIASGVAACPQFTPGSPAPACLSDPSIPFTPYVASMPALGAAAWTAGACTAFDPNAGADEIAQTCTRVTEQMTLVEPPAPGPTPKAAPAAPAATVVAVVAVPAFTG